nr:MAG TPA: hypothetical protein [Caudoviricetes sp.]
MIGGTNAVSNNISNAIFNTYIIVTFATVIT